MRSTRDHVFDGFTSYQVLVDPIADGVFPNGDPMVVIYAAMGNGIWRSNDTGQTWTLLQAGDATSIALSQGSACHAGQQWQPHRQPADPLRWHP